MLGNINMPGNTNRYYEDSTVDISKLSPNELVEYVQRLKFRGSVNQGGLSLIVGPMFSGKTTELILRLTRYTSVKYNVLYINHELDTRTTGNTAASSHNAVFKSLPSNISQTKTPSLNTVDISSYDVIGIDEAQFFQDLELTIKKWVLEDKKMVIVAGLDSKYDLTTFGSINTLLCIAQKVTKLSSICMNCLVDKAYYTHKKSSETGDIIIGGADKYMAVCLSCYQLLNITHNSL